MRKTTARVRLRIANNRYTNKHNIMVMSDYGNAKERHDQKAVRIKRGNCLGEKRYRGRGERHGQEKRREETALPEEEMLFKKCQLITKSVGMEKLKQGQTAYDVKENKRSLPWVKYLDMLQ